MDKPVQVTFHNLQHSEAVEEDIRARVIKLEAVADRMTSCRIVVGSPHKNQAGAKTFEVKIEMGLPGQTLIVDREPIGDLQSAISEAFDVAKKRLKTYRDKAKAS